MNEIVQVRPGNALRLVAIFAQPPPPSFPPVNPAPIQSIPLPSGEVVTVVGNLYNPAGPLVVVLFDALNNPTTVAATPTQASTGIYYVDVLIPPNAWPGKWRHQWYQQGAAVDSNFLQQHAFEVLAL